MQSLSDQRSDQQLEIMIRSGDPEEGLALLVIEERNKPFTEGTYNKYPILKNRQELKSGVYMKTREGTSKEVKRKGVIKTLNALWCHIFKLRTFDTFKKAHKRLRWERPMSDFDQGDLPFEDTLHQPNEEIPEDSLLAQMIEAIGKLPDRQREVIRFGLDGYKPAEVAKKMGITIGTVYQLRDQAKKNLKDRLKGW